MSARRLASAAALLGLTLSPTVIGCSSPPSTPKDGGEAAVSAPEPSAPTTSVPVVTPTAMPTVVPAAAGLVRTRGPVMVLSKGDEPPKLCVGPIQLVLPPTCGGLRLVGFDWADHEGAYVDSRGVRSGTFAATGRFDGTRFTVTGVVPRSEYDGPEEEPERRDLTTPCPPPPGGWRVIDPERISGGAVGRTHRVARGLPGFAGFWSDRQKPASNAAVEPAFEVRNIVNVVVAGDRARAERSLRRVWGGALCVSAAERSQREVQRIANRLVRLPGASSAAARIDEVHVDVTYDDGTLQAWADATYGDGLVTISSALVPASG